MGTRGLLVLGIGSVLVLGNPAFAQQPAPKPDYGAPITNEQAKTAAGAALAEAKKNNWRMAISVVGPAGDLVYFEKMDGSSSHPSKSPRARRVPRSGSGCPAKCSPIN